jgi:Domain of unknown function (DUF4190)
VSYDPNQSWGSAPYQSQPNAPTWPGYGQQPPEGTYPGNVPPPPGGYPGYPPPPGGAPPQAYPQQPYYGAYPGPMAPPTNGWAIASLVCAITAWFLFPIIGAIAGIICGHVALGEIKRSEGRYEGRGMAIAGLVISYTQIALAACLAAIIVAAFAVSGAGTGP